MSKYSFSHAERYAVFTAHRERCWLCDKPVSLDDFQVDHIIPEALDGNPQLSKILFELGRPADFNLNSYDNWMPAHGSCNRVKTNIIFEATPIIQTRLQIAADRAPKARELNRKFATHRKVSSAIEELLVANERNLITSTQRQILIGIVSQFHNENRAEEERGKPILLAPWLEIVGEAGGYFYVRGPAGFVGVRPKAPDLHHSWDCPRCGITGWNGTRCVSCGMMDDGD